MDKLLTIVIPTYNMQDYLRKCLDSLILPEDLMSRVEVLVVNDGSRDNSSAIAHEYEVRYPETFRVIDKENGNYGSCVNRGLAEARGKYIRVLDADDTFDNEAYAFYLRRLEDVGDVDLVLNDFVTVGCDGSVLEENVNGIDKEGIYDFQAEPLISSYYCVHTMTYRTEMLREIGYHQSEGMFYTDMQWSVIPMHAVKNCIYLPIKMYRYLYGREGQSMDPSVLTRTVDQHIAISKSLVTYYDQFPDEYKSGVIYQRVNREVEVLSRNIYKLCLIEQARNLFNGDALRAYDSFLKVERPDVYRLIGDSAILNGLPVHYVRIWRKTGIRLPLSLVKKVVRRIRYGK